MKLHLFSTIDVNKSLHTKSGRIKFVENNIIFIEHFKKDEVIFKRKITTVKLVSMVNLVVLKTSDGNVFQKKTILNRHYVYTFHSLLFTNMLILDKKYNLWPLKIVQSSCITTYFLHPQEFQWGEDGNRNSLIPLLLNKANLLNSET